MDTTQAIIIAAVAVFVLLVAAGLYLWNRQRTSARLHDRFGPEYEQAVEEYGGKGRAEAELRRRTERVEKLQIRPLSAPTRERFARAWDDAQAQFVDDPRGAVASADRLVQEVMAARGYPTSDFDQRAADISVDHPDLVRNYRSAHATSIASSDGRAGTEDLRVGFVAYRELFAELLATGDSTQGGANPIRQAS